SPSTATILRMPFTLPRDTRSSFTSPGDHRSLHSFPTRRSSDLSESKLSIISNRIANGKYRSNFGRTNTPLNSSAVTLDKTIRPVDRKSTRLNSSHVKISYAVFCLKKKKIHKNYKMKSKIQ